MASPRGRVCLLLGPKKSGKTSILNVVLDDIEPNSTLYNEPTRIPWTKRFNVFLDFEFWDLPGGRYDVEHLENLDLQSVGACLFVIDAQAIQGDNTDQARKMAGAIFKIHELNPATSFEIFIHKVDGMSDTYRLDVQQDLFNRIRDELNDLADMEFASSDDYIFPVINYHFTSIYQASIYDALSKVISRLMPCQGALERLLDMLVQNSNFDKAYLFDLASKLYFATDSTPGDAALHELCTEYTDLHWEMDQIYGDDEDLESNNHVTNGKKRRDSSVKIREAASGSISLSNGFAIAHWELSKDIALVVRLSSNLLNQANEPIEFNVGHFRDAIRQIRELEMSR